MPRRTLKRRYNGGLVDAKDSRDLADNELQTATGVLYKPGDPYRAHKLPGRQLFGHVTAAGSNEVDGLALCKFDSGGTDLLVILSNATLYKTDPSTFAASELDATVTGDQLSAAHANNRWYLAVKNENRVLKPDGTVRNMGMEAPDEGPDLSFLSTGTVARPTANSGSDFTNSTGDTDDGWDGDINTYLYSSLSAAGSGTTVIDGWTDNSVTGLKLIVIWSLAGSGGGSQPGLPTLYDWDLPGDVGGKVDAGWNISVKFRVSTDGVPTWTEIFNGTFTAAQSYQTLVTDIPNGTNLALVDLEATITYNSGTKTGALRIHDVKIQDSGEGSNFDWTQMYYAITEWDEDEGIESPPSVRVPTGQQTTKNTVVCTMPSGGAVNSNATHWKIYRTPDKGDETQLGFIGKMAIAETTFQDDFSLVDFDEQPSPGIPSIRTTVAGTSKFYFRDTPPPNLRRLRYYQGSLVGLSDHDKRALYYSVPAFPDSWPEIYTISTFNLPEHDELVDLVEVNGSLVIAGREVIVRMDGLPRTEGETFIPAEPISIPGAPGCVGPYAMTQVEYDGRSFAAWLSDENGVMITDGHEYRSISDDIDWGQMDGVDKSKWVLGWLPHIRCLYISCEDLKNPSGTNDRVYLLSLDKDHIKEGGQAKITGPHYGQVDSLAVGLVNNAVAIFSGSSAKDGKVYKELVDGYGQDDSDSTPVALGLSANANPMIVEEGSIYGPNWTSYEVTDVRLIHDGLGGTIDLEWDTGRDSSDGSDTKNVSSISVTSSGSAQVGIFRAGQFHRAKWIHENNSLGAILGVDVRIIPHGDEGDLGSG